MDRSIILLRRELARVKPIMQSSCPLDTTGLPPELSVDEDGYIMMLIERQSDNIQTYAQPPVPLLKHFPHIANVVDSVDVVPYPHANPKILRRF
jgi:hypothetical protein